MELSDPGKGYWGNVKLVLQYMMSIIDVGLLFEWDGDFGQYGYVDISYHFARESIKEDEILLQMVGIGDNPANRKTNVVI